MLDREQRDPDLERARPRTCGGCAPTRSSGQHLLSLDIGLPVEKLRRPIRNALAGNTEGNEVVLDATNRRGRAIRCKVTCLPLIVTSKDVQGVIVLMEQQGKAS